MADQPPPPDKTLENPTTSTTNSDQPTGPLSRNSSFSKLNAKAPEFVPKRSPTPPPPPTPSPIPAMIIPPPHPTAALVHVFPHTPTPMSVPIPVRAASPPLPHLPSPPHQHQQNHPRPRHANSNNNYNNNGNGNRSQYVVKSDKEGSGQSQGQGQQQSEKDHGNDNVNVASRNINENHKSKNNNNSNNVINNNNGLSEEATQKLINQVEYYFSDVNLATTDHLIRFIFKDPEGFVPISVVSSFKKIKALISGNSQLAAVLRNSTKLVVSEDGKKVKRLHPLTSSDMEELQARIIVAENLPEDHCHQNLMKIFSAVGSVKSIRTCQPQPSNNGASSASRSSKTDNMLYSNKVHAFVEYDTVDLAEKAMAELNDEDSWRNGLRVRPLLNKGSKPTQGRVKKPGNDGEVKCEDEDVSTSEQNQSEEYSGNLGAQSPEHGEEPNLDKEGGQKKNRNRARGKGRGRGHIQNHHHQNSRGSHMGGSANGEQPIVAKQPPPGPRMPDGTRGFSMGRGRPIAVTTA